VLELTAHPRPPHEAIDALMALQLRVARLLLDRPRFAPLRVALERPRPALVEPFERFFRAPLSFAAPSNALELDAADLDARLPAGNTEVARRIDDVLARYLARVDERDALGRLRAAILDRLPDGAPAQSAMARVLGMSARTLQRRLNAAGVSYQSLLDDARRELAAVYLNEGWSVTETAFTLGFADCSSFSRAYRRWTGTAPSAHAARRTS
jgi:AraC-like DNA-binding protein